MSFRPLEGWEIAGQRWEILYDKQIYEVINRV